ncbi:MAG TPA: ATP-binding protein [Edaphocola sp.]|nr:ATP-binding protein [Edaphocola sp.]
MLTNKNIPPRILSFITAIILAVIIVCLGLFLFPEWHIILITALVVFTSSYLIFYYTLTKFIYRKLKLIYKFIHEVKTAKELDFLQEKMLAQMDIDMVSKDVAQWGIKKKEEISSLQQNEKFRKEFLSNLSHELKTPVFAIQSYIETLLDGAYQDEKVSMNFLQKAAKNTDRLIHLLEDISLISEIESNELKLSSQKFIIQDLTKEVFDELALKAQNKGVTFHIKKGCEDPIKVIADRGRIYQVMVNLLDNAIKYGKENGEIVVSFYNVDEKKALVEISDNGYGIEEEYLSRLFERFYRVDKARSRKEGGTGLGLAIVKHIMEAHGQTINIRSKPNVGTTFGFTLDLS